MYGTLFILGPVELRITSGSFHIVAIIDQLFLFLYLFSIFICFFFYLYLFMYLQGDMVITDCYYDSTGKSDFTNV